MSEHNTILAAWAKYAQEKGLAFDEDLDLSHPDLIAFAKQVNLLPNAALRAINDIVRWIKRSDDPR